MNDIVQVPPEDRPIGRWKRRLGPHARIAAFSRQRLERGHQHCFFFDPAKQLIVVLIL
jgi:hypothetical protein